MSTQKALEVSLSSRTIKDIPIYKPEAGEILIKNVFVASNPKDWKYPMWFQGHSMVEGSDIAGYVEAVGEGVKDFKKGDKVAAFTKIGTHEKFGAYAQYSISHAFSAFHLGEKTKFEDAVTLPLAYMTAVIGLFDTLGLPTPDQPTKEKTPILIYGGATAVGVFAIQLAKKAGLYVVAIAGAGIDVARSYGADEVIDYRNKSDEELVKAMTSAAGGNIRIVYDAVSENNTFTVVPAALKAKGGRYIVVLPLPEDVQKSSPKNVKATLTSVVTAHEGNSELTKKWLTKLGEWLEKGEFRGHKWTLLPNGLAGIEEGLKRLQDGKVSGEKLIYKISDTPGLS